MYGAGGPGSNFGDGNRQGSVYGAEVATRAGSFYGGPDPRMSTYSYGGPQMAQVHPGMPDHRQSSFSLAPQLQDPRASSYSLNQDHHSVVGQSRPQSFLPELRTSNSDQLNAGAEAITAASFEQSIRRICTGADLDTMTKRELRRRLEEEYGVSLASRREELGHIIDEVLAGKFFPLQRSIIVGFRSLD